MGKKKKKVPEGEVHPGQSAGAMLLSLGKEGFLEFILKADRSDLDRYVHGLTGRVPNSSRSDEYVIQALTRWAEGDKNWTFEPPLPTSNDPTKEGEMKKGTTKKGTEKKAAPAKEKKARKPGVCAFIAERLKAKEDTNQIVAGIRKNFPDSKATSKDVSIIRNKMKKGLM